MTDPLRALYDRLVAREAHLGAALDALPESACDRAVGRAGGALIECTRWRHEVGVMLGIEAPQPATKRRRRG